MQPVVLKNARLLLREIAATDLPALVEMLSDEEQVRYIEFEATESSARVLLDWSLKSAQEARRTAYSLALTLPPDDSFVGTISLVIRDWEQREGHLGYILHRNFQGRGLTTAAAKLVMAFGFEQLGLHRICATCHAKNLASVRVIEKLGLRQEAHFREAFWRKNKWHDRLMYAMLDREWNALT